MLRRLGHCQRIESHATSIGVPDIELCTYTQNQWWIELKVWYADKGVTIRPAQKRWHIQRAIVGGKSLVLIHFPSARRYALLWGDDAVHVKPKELTTWLSLALYVWDDEIDFEQLKDFLYETKSR